MMTTTGSALDDALQRVMYDPLGYLHRDRFPQLIAPTQFMLRSIVNDALIEQYQLPLELAFTLRREDFSQALVQHWLMMPHVVFLLGCYMLRTALPIGGVWLKVPEFARRFTQMPSRDVVATKHSGVVSEQAVWRHGAQRLWRSCSTLPAALARRLPLLLPTCVDEVFSFTPTRVLNAHDQGLLILALHYATRNQDQPCAFTH